MGSDSTQLLDAAHTWCFYQNGWTVLQREGATPSSSENDEVAPMVVEAEGTRGGKECGDGRRDHHHYCEQS